MSEVVYLSATRWLAGWPDDGRWVENGYLEEMAIPYACLILNRPLQSAVPRGNVLGVCQPPLVVVPVLGGERILE